jgi:hypothetical protein
MDPGDRIRSRIGAGEPFPASGNWKEDALEKEGGIAL